MHTSTRLRADDFHFWQQTARASYPVDFATFSPNYHEQDRVGVISLGLEDGVLQTSYALLALTTAFYDCLRARGNDFFDYPQHFAFVGAEANREVSNGKVTNGGINEIGASPAAIAVHAGSAYLPANTPQLWNAWSWLDVWPDAKWITAPTNAAAMLQRAFDYQINRLFWPRSLNLVSHQASVPEAPLPAYLWKMLKTNLKVVYLYGEPSSEDDSNWAALAGERIEIRAMTAAQEIVQESIVQLPAPLLLPGALNVANAATTPQRYERVGVDLFLTTMQREFEPSLTN
jgi:hypothetical protein